MITMKFGSAVLADSDALACAAQVVKSRLNQRPVVVVPNGEIAEQLVQALAAQGVCAAVLSIHDINSIKFALEKSDCVVVTDPNPDYAAASLAQQLDAAEIEIWTDVDGVRTADPHRLTLTHCLDKISYEEAAELAHFGLKLLSPMSIAPAMESGIPMHVYNLYNPEAAGTEILPSEKIDDGVKSITFKEDIQLVNIFSPRMIATAGFLSRVFDIFARYNVSVDLISTSEANISVTVDEGQDLAEIVAQLSQFAQVVVANDKSQVSIIGKNAANQRGLMRWAMTAFNNTTISMISQGASYVNISYVVERHDLDEVLQLLHQYLFEY